jgi:molybdopterin converting factor small subunit
MRVQLTYLGPLKTALHKDSEEIPLPDKARLRDLLRILAERSGERFKLYIFDLSEAWAKVEGAPESLIEGDQWRVMMAVNDVPHHQLQGLDTELAERDHVTLSLFFSGGG